MSRYERLNNLIERIATDEEYQSIRTQCPTCMNIAELRSLHTAGQRCWVCQSCQNALTEAQLPNVEFPSDSE